MFIVVKEVWEILDEMCRDGISVHCSTADGSLWFTTDPEQNCQHVIFFNLSPLRSNASHRVALHSLLSVSLWILYFFHFPWRLFSCISQEWGFSSWHAVHQTEGQAFVLKGHFSWIIRGFVINTLIVESPQNAGNRVQMNESKTQLQRVIRLLSVCSIIKVL